MRVRKGAATAGLLVAASILGIQFLLPARGTNPPVIRERTIEANLRLTPVVSGTLHRVCANCHSNETRWPWYSRITPLSWLIHRDVHNAREVMNFSEWTTGIGRQPANAAGILAAACADVKSNRMPPKSYLLLHPEARLPPQEKQAFCDWTRAQFSELVLRSRTSPHTPSD